MFVNGGIYSCKDNYNYMIVIQTKKENIYLFEICNFYGKLSTNDEIKNSLQEYIDLDLNDFYENFILDSIYNFKQYINGYLGKIDELQLKELYFKMSEIYDYNK